MKTAKASIALLFAALISLPLAGGCVYDDDIIMTEMTGTSASNEVTMSISIATTIMIATTIVTMTTITIDVAHRRSAARFAFAAIQCGHETHTYGAALPKGGAVDLNLKDRVVIVTGGASGIGLATARAFAAEGARVSIWDIGDSSDRASKNIVAEFAVKSIGLIADITDASAIDAAAKRTSEALGPVDHLVHAAAIGSGKFGFPFTNLTPADWPRVLQVNITGMVNVAHALAPHMVERRTGTMVFVASVAGQIGSQTDPPYSASKAANINFAQCMAKDLAPHGIRVNTVCPGMVQTPLNRSVWQAWHDQAAPGDRLTYEAWSADKIRKIVPLGKWQTPEAIADMIVFLSSDRAAHVTGQTINVDGGFVMHW